MKQLGLVLLVLLTLVAAYEESRSVRKPHAVVYTKDGQLVSGFTYSLTPEQYIHNHTHSSLITVRNRLEGLSFEITNEENLTHILLRPGAYSKGESIGYKHMDKNQTIRNYLKGILYDNSLAFVGIRFDDTFTIIMEEISKGVYWKIIYFRIQYLHPTLPIKDIIHQPYILVRLGQTENTVIDVDGSRRFQPPEKVGSFRRKLHGQGLHQKLNYTISAPQLLNITSNCSFVVEDILPPSTYVNIDQLPNTISYETIDVQKPAHFSKQYYYSFSMNLGSMNRTGAHDFQFQQPIHFRYPEPLNVQEYTIVPIWNTEGAYIQCQGVKYRLEQDLLNDRGAAKIPNGIAAENSFVTLLTFVCTMLCALLLTRHLRHK